MHRQKAGICIIVDYKNSKSLQFSFLPIHFHFPPQREELVYGLSKSLKIGFLNTGQARLPPCVKKLVTFPNFNNKKADYLNKTNTGSIFNFQRSQTGIKFHIYFLSCLPNQLVSL